LHFACTGSGFHGIQKSKMNDTNASREALDVPSSDGRFSSRMMVVTHPTVFLPVPKRRWRR